MTLCQCELFRRNTCKVICFVVPVPQKAADFSFGVNALTPVWIEFFCLFTTPPTYKCRLTLFQVNSFFRSKYDWGTCPLMSSSLWLCLWINFPSYFCISCSESTGCNAKWYLVIHMNVDFFTLNVCIHIMYSMFPAFWVHNVLCIVLDGREEKNKAYFWSEV